MDVWGALWPSTPKVHRSAVRDILAETAVDTTYETIIHKVCLRIPNAEVEDQIATARAIRDTLAQRRIAIVQERMPQMPQMP